MVQKCQASEGEIFKWNQSIIISIILDDTLKSACSHPEYEENQQVCLSPPMVVIQVFWVIPLTSWFERGKREGECKKRDMAKKGDMAREKNMEWKENW